MDMHEFTWAMFLMLTSFRRSPQPRRHCFRTFAPSAERITIIGEWNDWQEENMIKDGHVWSYFPPRQKGSDV